jgi:hypothetical protein
MKMHKAIWFAAVVALLPGASVAGPKFDGNWNTHMACEA